MLSSNVYLVYYVLTLVLTAVQSILLLILGYICTFVKMSANKEDSLRRVRRRKTVIGPRQELRRIKERVDSFLLEASQQENQYRQLQTSHMVNVLCTEVYSMTLDMVPITTNTHAQTDSDDLQHLEIDLSHYEHIGKHETHNEDQPESYMSSYSEYFDDGMNKDSDVGNDAYEIKVKQTILEWVVECNVPSYHVSNILRRLNVVAKLSFLPLDSRTLLSSRRGKLNVKDMFPGKYHHFGVEESLQALLLSMDSRKVPIPYELNILFNIDGLPLSNSSSSEFWPILFKVQGLEDVLIAGIYHEKKTRRCKRFSSRRLAFPVIPQQPLLLYALNRTTRTLVVGNASPKVVGLQPEHHEKNGRQSILEKVLRDAVNDLVIDYMHLVCI
ncbi:Uncharacterized protein APZ42_018483 [Daphnia magna]|uniref:Uncharacterized protein n=1 Tax=Daphnia magna TaxID=35525 RepID=A0A164Z2L6_9CRUS|nr:Uncharacterized protein APZ42_018483 [Daphnia magna]